MENHGHPLMSACLTLWRAHAWLLCAKVIKYKMPLLWDVFWKRQQAVPLKVRLLTEAACTFRDKLRPTPIEDTYRFPAALHESKHLTLGFDW